MNDVDTMKTKPEPFKHDWSRLDAMTEAEKHAVALADPDTQPLTEEGLKRMKRAPWTKVMRRALRLSPEEFATRFRIPLDTLEDWEAGRTDPDAVARVYLYVIARNSVALKPRFDPEA